MHTLPAQMLVSRKWPAPFARTELPVPWYTLVDRPMAEGAPGAETPSQGVDLSALKQPLLAGGVILALAVGGVVAFKKIKERR